MSTVDTITIDFETYSEANLKKVGAAVYSEHPSTDIICMSWAFNDDPVQVWTPGLPFPGVLAEAIENGHLVEAHNSFFERMIWLNVGMRLYKFPSVGVQQWRCSMAACA